MKTRLADYEKVFKIKPEPIDISDESESDIVIESEDTDDEF